MLRCCPTSRRLECIPNSRRLECWTSDIRTTTSIRTTNNNIWITTNIWLRKIKRTCLGVRFIFYFRQFNSWSMHSVSQLGSGFSILIIHFQELFGKVLFMRSNSSHINFYFFFRNILIRGKFLRVVIFQVPFNLNLIHPLVSYLL